MGDPALSKAVVEELNKNVIRPAQPVQQQAIVPIWPMVQQITVANYQVPLPEKFSFKSCWIKCCELFRKVTSLDQKDGES